MRKTAILFALMTGSGLILTASAPLYAQAPDNVQIANAQPAAPTVAYAPADQAPQPQLSQDPKDSPYNYALADEAARVQRQVEEQKQREQRRAAQEARLRSMISGYGFTSTATQDAILDYLRQEGEARGPINEASRRLIAALRNGTPPERVRDLINDYKEVIQADRDRRTTAQAALDAKVGFSLDPRLEALLWVSGIVGDGQGFSMQVYNAPRTTSGKNTNAVNQVSPPLALAPRQGVIIGALLSRGDVSNGEFWVEVGSERGDRERYTASWNPQTSSLDPKVVKAISETPLGSRVRLEWNGNDRKSIVSLALATDDPVTMPDAPLGFGNRADFPENTLTTPTTTNP